MDENLQLVHYGGSLETLVAEVLVRKNPVLVEVADVNDVFTESGRNIELQKIYGLTSKEIV